MWITMAWQYILPDVTVKGFKMQCIYNAVNETDDGKLRNDSEEERNVRSQH